MKITLTAWAARHFSPAPSIRTLRAWVASGSIFPAPVKVGRVLMVDEDAEYRPLVVEVGNVSDRVAGILRRAA